MTLSSSFCSEVLCSIRLLYALFSSLILSCLCSPTRVGRCHSSKFCQFRPPPFLKIMAFYSLSLPFLVFPFHFRSVISVGSRAVPLTHSPASPSCALYRKSTNNNLRQVPNSSLPTAFVRMCPLTSISLSRPLGPSDFTCFLSAYRISLEATQCANLFKIISEIQNFHSSSNFYPPRHLL